MEFHSPDIYGAIGLAGSVGTSGQVLTSQGVGNQVIWSTAATLVPRYLYTDKAAQTIVLGPADINWNTPAADAISGLTYNAPGTFTLTAGRLYTLRATLIPTVAALAYSISWVDSTNAVIGSLNQPASGLANLDHVHAYAVFKPLVGTIVKLRLTSAVALTLGTICSVSIHTEN